MYVVQLYYIHEGKATLNQFKTQEISMDRGQLIGLIVQTLLELRFLQASTTKLDSALPSIEKSLSCGYSENLANDLVGL